MRGSRTDALARFLECSERNPDEKGAPQRKISAPKDGPALILNINPALVLQNFPVGKAPVGGQGSESENW